MCRTREENAADLQYEETARKDFERRIYEECDAEDAEEDAVPLLQGVCKDCSSGTLNNDLNPAFHDNGADQLVCDKCGSTHLDLL